MPPDRHDALDELLAGGQLPPQAPEPAPVPVSAAQPDAATWGTTPDAVAGQQAMMSMFGGS